MGRLPKENQNMALFPCDAHGGRYRGPQQTAYPALVNGGDTTRARRRLCPQCFTRTLDWCADHLSDAAVDDIREDGCATCSADEATWGVFVTLYAKSQERQDWYGRVCTDCAQGDEMLALFGKQLEIPL
jgi:hypothetical protein